MTDKPKNIVPLKAIPKEAPPEEKKYKVSQEVIDKLQALVDSLKLEANYEVPEGILYPLTSMLEFTQQGLVHDIFCVGVHKDSVWVDGCSHTMAVCEQTSKSPYKFMMLAKEVLDMRLEDMKYFMAGAYDE